jgi:hypothetical protein
MKVLAVGTLLAFGASVEGRSPAYTCDQGSYPSTSKKTCEAIKRAIPNYYQDHVANGYNIGNKVYGKFGKVCAVTDIDNRGSFTKRWLSGSGTTPDIYGDADTGVFKSTNIKKNKSYQSSQTSWLSKYYNCPGKITGMPSKSQDRDYLGGGPRCGCSPLNWITGPLGGKASPGAPSNANGDSIPNTQSGYSFDQAAAHCEDIGMRLCEYGELKADITLATGCFYTFQRTWTQSPCGKDGNGDTMYYTTSGRSWCSYNPFQGQTKESHCEGASWNYGGDGKCGGNIGVSADDECVKVECLAKDDARRAVARCCADDGGQLCASCPRHADTSAGNPAVDAGDCDCNSGYDKMQTPSGFLCYPGTPSTVKSYLKCSAGGEYELSSTKKCSLITGSKKKTSTDMGVCALTQVASGCSGARPNFYSAENFCEHQGMRLCTVEELKADVAKDTGCNYDSGKRIWTRETCGLQRKAVLDSLGNPVKNSKGKDIEADYSMFWTLAGSFAGLGGTALECTPSDFNDGYSRCCANIAARGQTGTCQSAVPGSSCPSWNLLDDDGSNLVSSLSDFDDIAGMSQTNALKVPAARASGITITGCTCDIGWSVVTGGDGVYGQGGCSYTNSPTSSPVNDPTASPTMAPKTSRPTRSPTTKRPTKPVTLPPTMEADDQCCPAGSYFFMSAKRCKELIRAKRYVNWVQNTTQDDLEADFGDGFVGDWRHGVCSNSKWWVRNKKGKQEGKCLKTMAWASASAYCKNNGGRLCTVQELESDYAADSGCNRDWEYVWSDTPCADGKFWATAGKSSFSKRKPSVCRNANVRNKMYMRCCADGAKNACKPNWPWSSSNKCAIGHEEVTCKYGWRNAPPYGCKPPPSATFKCASNQYIVGSQVTCKDLNENCRGGEQRCWREGTWKNKAFQGAYPWSTGICANSIHHGNGHSHWARQSVNGCSGKVNQAGADGFCKSFGGRLPTLKEVRKMVVRGTGCRYDREQIWTSSKCGPNKFWVLSGMARTFGKKGPRTSPFGKRTKCVGANQKRYMTRCIGDINGSKTTGKRCVACPTGSTSTGNGDLYSCKPKSGFKWDWEKQTVVKA